MDLQINIEIVQKTEADWLWTVYDVEGALIDCGHESSMASAREAIMGTVENTVDAALKKAISKPAKKGG